MVRIFLGDTPWALTAFNATASEFATTTSVSRPTNDFDRPLEWTEELLWIHIPAARDHDRRPSDWPHHRGQNISWGRATR